MPAWETIVLAVGLAMDALAVSIGVGTSGVLSTVRQRARLSFHFGVFQALMPVVGWFAGSRVAELVADVDHWIAFALLAFVGGRMVREGLRGDDEPTARDPSRGRTLVLLSTAVSIDALAVGFSLAMIEVAILEPSIVIGVVTGTLSLLGLLAGRRLGEAVGRWAQVIGGAGLVAIGARIVISHLG